MHSTLAALQFPFLHVSFGGAAKTVESFEHVNAYVTFVPFLFDLITLLVAFASMATSSDETCSRSQKLSFLQVPVIFTTSKLILLVTCGYFFELAPGAIFTLCFLN